MYCIWWGEEVVEEGAFGLFSPASVVLHSSLSIFFSFETPRQRPKLLERSAGPFEVEMLMYEVTQYHSSMFSLLRSPTTSVKKALKIVK